ncbi:MAG: VCBS repeat-containing protein [Acidobacteria bacterium]|nr:VCBS repeat-containing protein [Acidobacteriota bacterium]
MPISSGFGSVLAIGILVVLSTLSASAAAGDVDATFNAYVARTANWTPTAGVRTSEVLPDGKVLIGGMFRVAGGLYRTGIARLNVDGTVDPTFTPPEITGLVDVAVTAIGLLPSGKILIAGDFQNVDGLNMRGIARLNADGTSDVAYNTALQQKIYIFNGNVNDIEVLADSRFLLAGSFTLGLSPTTTVTRSVYRITDDGSYDPTFNSSDLAMSVQKLKILPDGKLFAAGSSGQFFNYTGLARLHADGYIDFSFSGVNAGGAIYDFEVMPNGQIIVVGSFVTLNGFAQGRISRINADGSVDLSFMANNPGADGDIRTLDILSGGKMLVGGAFSTFNSLAKPKLLRLNSDATVDAAFTYDQVNDGGITTAQLFTDGRILIGGIGGLWERIGILNNSGTLQPVNNFVGDTGLVRTMVQQPDGKILVAGRFEIANGIRRGTVVRFNADGTFDTSFVPTGLPASMTIRRLTLQPDGKIIIGTGTSAVYRLLPDGTADPGFALGFYSFASNSVNDIAVLGNGSLIIAGSFNPSSSDLRRIARYSPTGVLDGSFTTPVINGAINRLIVQPDGKILIGGEFTQIGATLRGHIARLNSDGSLDATFNPIGGANNYVNDLARQSDGKVVIGGVFSAVGGSNGQSRIGRLNGDGSLDTTFTASTNSPVESLRLQPDGKIVIGGQFTNVGAAPSSGIARLNPNGSLDAGFGVGSGANNRVWEVLIQSDGKIVAGGEFGKFNGQPRISIVRLFAATSGGAKFDYDGDGKADVSVFRPATNRWYLRLSSNPSVVENDFGLSGDVIAPADFDGDGKTDIAIYRPSSGDWWYLASATNTQSSVRWGLEGDVPRPSDFDGDGKADFIVYRPSDNVWYRFGSSGQVLIQQFGSSGDKTVVADFNGDARSDIAIFRPSTGDWWFIDSSTGQNRVEHWGISTDVPVPADYDGDGKTDFAVFRPATGVWYVKNSGNPTPTIITFGLASDKPVAADYDGDGKADVAVYRPSDGVWYILQSTNGFIASQLGNSTDRPTPNAFVP